MEVKKIHRSVNLDFSRLEEKFDTKIMEIWIELAVSSLSYLAWYLSWSLPMPSGTA